jgi:hypothetical protein
LDGRAGDAPAGLVVVELIIGAILGTLFGPAARGEHQAGDPRRHKSMYCHHLDPMSGS